MCTQVHKADFLKIMSKPLDILLHFYHTRTIYDHGTFSYAHVTLQCFTKFRIVLGT